mgnify:CR=1 FL=1
MSIRLENVNYIYGEGTGQEKWALKNINLTLHDNEFVGIVAVSYTHLTLPTIA